MAGWFRPLAAAGLIALGAWLVWRRALVRTV
jgi:hypothetical protein